MAYYNLPDNFNSFFKKLNPSPSFEHIASQEYASVKSLIEDRYGPAATLAPKCFLQGSYRQQTAIHTINDVDIVALCELWQPGSGAAGTRSWGRDEIFDTIAAAIARNQNYRGKIRYNSQSTCIKVDLSIKLEILPVVYKAGNNDPQKEPFRLHRPERQQWEDGYARYHQGWLSWKNDDSNTKGNFIPAIKVLKHIRSIHNVDAVSFHIECLLYSFPNEVFIGPPADYITKMLNFIASTPASTWYSKVVNTPCGERDIFTAPEWTSASWNAFHEFIGKCAALSSAANISQDKSETIRYWQAILGSNYFPAL
ncbi:MAG TPA: hypothetical protein VF656_18130 [Pyrinomonadaceae bacterium]|jgi:hypothetical protein